MRRFTQLSCCAALALGLVSSQTFAGPLGSAASDAFRRLPQSAPPPAASTVEAAAAAPAPAPASTDAGSAVVVENSNAPAGPIDVLPDLANPLPSDAGTPTGGDASNGGVVVRDELPSRVPEPGVLWLLGAGVLGLAIAHRRRK